MKRLLFAFLICCFVPAFSFAAIPDGLNPYLQNNSDVSYDKNNPAESLGVEIKPQTQNIRGSVQGHTDHNLSGAKITLYVDKNIPVVSTPNQTTTDTSGIFQINNAPENARFIYVEHDDYFPEYFKIEKNSYFSCKLKSVNQQNLCEKSGGDWKRKKCICDSKKSLVYNENTFACEHFSVATITVKVQDEYSQQLIKGITVCYNQGNDCKKTSANGGVVFEQDVLENEKINPKVRLQNNDGYDCDVPQEISTEQENVFEFLVQCKKSCTDKDYKKMMGVEKCYVKGDNQYDIIKCKLGYEKIDNKCLLPQSQDEEIDVSFSDCFYSGGTWNGTGCECDENKKLKPIADNKRCECINAGYEYNLKSEKCENLSIDRELLDSDEGIQEILSLELAEQNCIDTGGLFENNNCNCGDDKTYNQVTGFCECKDKNKVYSPKSKKCDSAVVQIILIDVLDNNKPIKNVKICDDKGKHCKKTDKDGIAKFAKGQTIKIDDEKCLCSPQFLEVLSDERVGCKQICTKNDLKKIPNATKCYVKPNREYEIVTCKEGYRPTNDKTRCYEIDDNFTEEEVQVPLNVLCFYSGGDWNANEYKCDCDKSKGLKDNRKTQVCECRDKNMSYSSKAEQCVSYKENCVASGGEWKDNDCICDGVKNLKKDNVFKKCISITEPDLSDYFIYAPEEQQNENSDVIASFSVELIGVEHPEPSATEKSKQKILDAMSVLSGLEDTLDVSVWKNADGKFNTVRLASDATAGVVLGTAGGLISNKLIKKNQIKKGFEGISCYVGGQIVADYGDQFTVGMK